MDSLKEKVKKELLQLYDEGAKLHGDVLQPDEKAKKHHKAINLIAIQKRYQMWYSQSLATIHRLLPERLEEFQEQYRLQKRKAITVTTYTIADYLNGIKVTKQDLYGEKKEVFHAQSVFFSRFQQQLFILNSAVTRVDSLLADIEGVLQSQIFDSEVEAAMDLLKKKHLRAAGALAGVTLEAHLRKVCQNHVVTFRKKSPTISDYNEGLKKISVVDVPTWRLIQRLGDIRNLAVHAKDRDPTSDEISDLISGVRKTISTVF